MNKPEWIKSIEEREAKATKGPWHMTDRYPDYSDEERRPSWSVMGSDGYGILSTTHENWPRKEDQAFVINSRQDIPSLLSALNKAYEVIERTKEILLSGAEGAICDTIWESSCGTLVDYLDSFLLDVYNPDQQKLPLEAINQEGK